MFSLVRILVLSALVYAGLDAAVFRSGHYYRWVEPDSTAGTALSAVATAQRLHRPGVRNVVVIGDSRVGVGMTFRALNDAIAGSDLNLIPLSIPGSTPRVWPHVLDGFDMAVHPVAAVVFAVADLDDAHEFEDLDNRELDLAYLAPLLRMSDATALPATFTDGNASRRALRQIVLPGTAMRDDAVRFLGAPQSRIDLVWLHRREEIYWKLAFAGTPGRLLDDPVRQLAEKEGDHSWVIYAERLVGVQRPMPVAVAAAYRSRWFGALADRCASATARMLVLPLPRGPYHRTFAQDTGVEGSLADMVRQGRLEVLDHAPSRSLEQPQFFSDTLHLNADGMRAYSVMVACAIRAALDRK